MHAARVREGEKSFMDAINYLHVGERGRDYPSNSRQWAGTAVLRVCVCGQEGGKAMGIFFCLCLNFLCYLQFNIWGNYLKDCFGIEYNEEN